MLEFLSLGLLSASAGFIDLGPICMKDSGSSTFLLSHMVLDFRIQGSFINFFFRSQLSANTGFAILESLLVGYGL